MNVKVIDFKPSHIDLSNIRSREFDFLSSYDHDLMMAKLEDLHNKSTAISLIIDGNIISSGGFYKMWNGVFTLWQMPTVSVKRFSKTYAKTVRAWVNSEIKNINGHRFQSECLNDALHNSWMRFLGFNVESILKKFSSEKEDYAMFVRFKNGN